MTYELFPLGLAMDEHFCNRESEREILQHYITQHTPVMIASPRRYGKSSLVHFVLKNFAIPFASVDFFVALEAKTIAEQILLGIEQLLNQTSNKVENILRELKNYLSASQWTLGIKNIGLALIPKQDHDPALIIQEALFATERYLAKKKKSAVLFIDEFQELSALPEAKAIEGAIRHVAQESRHLTFVFSGSNRHILSTQFEDRSRPLYLLCNKIQLERISQDHYVKFLNKFAQKTWKKKLLPETLDAIFRCTEQHPYYTNVLCNYIWANHAKDHAPPSANTVEKYWLEYTQQEKFRVARELSLLNFGERNMLVAIASGMESELTSMQAQQKIKRSSASLHVIVKNLLASDFIAKRENNTYFIIDPLIKSSLKQNYITH